MRNGQKLADYAHEAQRHHADMAILIARSRGMGMETRQKMKLAALTVPDEEEKQLADDKTPEATTEKWKSVEEVIASVKDWPHYNENADFRARFDSCATAFFFDENPETAYAFLLCVMQVQTSQRYKTVYPILVSTICDDISDAELVYENSSGVRIANLAVLKQFRDLVLPEVKAACDAHSEYTVTGFDSILGNIATFIASGTPVRGLETLLLLPLEEIKDAMVKNVGVLTVTFTNPLQLGREGA